MKKRRTKKVQAKLELLELADKHAFLTERKRVAELIDIINDVDLMRVVANFILAKQELELCLEGMKSEIAPHLPDDSDF
jgi:hypothetical protein